MSTTSIDSLIDQAAQSHPEPSHAAEELRAEARAEIALDAPPVLGGPPPGWTPPLGWDASLHAYPPERTTRGTWRRKRKGDAQQQLTPDGEIPTDPAAAASNMCALFFSSAQVLLGEDWEPQPAERVEVERQLARWFALHGCIDLPPGVALVLAVGVYAGPRLLLPTTRERLSTIVGNVRSFFGAAQHDQQTPASARAQSIRLAQEARVS